MQQDKGNGDGICPYRDGQGASRVSKGWSYFLRFAIRGGGGGCVGKRVPARGQVWFGLVPPGGVAVCWCVLPDPHPPLC